MGKVGQALQRYRPRTITGGAPIFPLLILFGLNAVDELDRTAFSVLVPNIKAHFNVDLKTILTILGVFPVFTLILLIPIAHWADHGKRVRVAVFGAIAWGGFSLLTGLAPALWVFALARAGSGLGRSVNEPTHHSLLADYYDVSVRANVYGFHRAANSVGMFLGPLIAGILAHFFGWRIPFIVFALPTVVFVMLSFRLKEPVRGRHERRAMGASDETAETEELPPSFAEAWRIVWQVRTLRRIWYSIPFLLGALIGLQAMLSVYYEEIFHLKELQRGFLFSFLEPAQLIGLLIGIPIANRLLATKPDLALKLFAVMGSVLGVLLVGLAVAPNLAVAVAVHFLIVGCGAILAPGIAATQSITIPPRVRSLGFAVGGLWILPGIIVLNIVGRVGDAMGIRAALLFIVPVLVLGAFILASAGQFVESDVQRVRTSAVAQSEVLAARRRGEVKLLLVKGLDAGYDGVQVLFGVDFEIDQGEIVALLGTNGAGKSTLLRSISGLLEASGGAIIFDGRDMTFAPPNEVAGRGVVQVPGGRGVFPTLTVEENLRIAGWLYRRDAAYVREATDKVCDYFPVLRQRFTQQAGILSGGEQQMLTLAQAFIAKPRLLMIDELSLGLAPIVVEQLLQIVRAIRDQGATVVLVEQSVNIALTLAQTAYFMEKGEIRFHGPTADLLKRPDILRSVFLEGAASVTGGQTKAGGNGQRPAKAVTRTPRRTDLPPAASILEVSDLAKSFGGVQAVNGVSFSLPEGRILGVIGPNGAGKTTVFDLISGFLPVDGGRIMLSGTDITQLSADSRARLRLGRSFQDARLFPALTVAETIAVALDRTVDSKDPVAEALHLPVVRRTKAGVTKRVDEVIDLMGLGAFRNKFISELSTGSRRIVDLACIVVHDPKVLLLDEPSSGIAQRETEALGPLLLRIQEATGASLLVIEHDMPLVTSIADEILALDLGRVIARGTPSEVVNHPEVVASYLGSTEAVIERSGSVAPKRAPARARKLRGAVTP